MPTVESAPLNVGRLTCPLCDTALDPAHPTECTRCDWVVGYRRRREAPVGTDRDLLSVVLSIVPGLGHLYKGHLPLGALFLLGGVVALVMTAVIATFTMGLGLVLLPFYWLAVMIHAYFLHDRRAPVASMTGMAAAMQG